MVKVGVDISLKSTAIVINYNDSLHYFSFITKKPDNVWLKKIESFVNITQISYMIEDEKSQGNTKYSKSEIQKLDNYNDATDVICNTIVDFFKDKPNYPDIIQIEGYSQENQQGRLIDIVTFSTLLRIKLRKSFDAIIDIIPPSSMKKAAGAIVYGVGKDKMSRNNVLNEKGKGKAAGSFNKFDMLLAIKEYKNQNLLKDWLDVYYDEIIKMKKIPSPIDDLVDAFFLQEIINE